MDHAVTVGDILLPLLGIGGMAIVVIICVCVLSIVADEWKH